LVSPVLTWKASITSKNGHLEIRPTFVQREASTRGHVFVVMLACLLERELDHYWRHLDLTVSEALDELGSLRGVELTLGPATCQQVPQPTGICRQLLTNAHPQGWSLVQTTTDFDKLASNDLSGVTNPNKVVGTVQAATTTQQARILAAKGADPANPSGVAFNTNVPSLATMSKGALNLL